MFEPLLETVERFKKDQPIHTFLDSLERSPLHIAAMAGRDTNMEVMLNTLLGEAKRKAVTAAGIDGMTPLHLATNKGSDDCVVQLLNNWEKSRPHQFKDVWGRGPLHIAASFGYHWIAQRLLRDLKLLSEQEDHSGRTPRDYLLKGDLDLTEIGDVGDPTKMDKAHNKRALLLELARLAPPGSSSDKEGKTYLHYAAAFMDESAVVELLKRGFDLNAKDSIHGSTPLHEAIRKRRTDLAVSLIKGLNGFKASFKTKDKLGATAFLLACRVGLLGVIKTILELDPTVKDDMDNDNATAMHYAVEFFDPDCTMLKFLVEKGCAPTPVPRTKSVGRTALHHGLEQGNDAAGVFILNLPNHQWDPQDHDHISLLITACQRDCPRSIEILTKKWPEWINLTHPRDGQTPLIYACDYGKVEIVKTLLDWYVFFQQARRYNMRLTGTIARTLTPISKQRDGTTTRLFMQLCLQRVQKS